LDSTQRKLVGERLAIVRSDAGLSQKEMGKRLSVSWRSYQNYELGMREPPLDMVSAVCELFDVRFVWLIEGIGGRKATRDYERLRQVIISIDQISALSDLKLDGSSLADILVRLMKRMDEGLEVTDTEIRNYVELKGGLQNE